MSTAPVPTPEPNPGSIFDAINAYQRSAAVKAAVELDVFTAISNGSRTAREIAATAGATERGMRILCDYLAIIGLLTKDDGQYSLTVDSAMFLDRNSKACLASSIGFLLHPEIMSAFGKLTDVVRNGMPGEGTVSSENPVWVEFARDMTPMAYPTAVNVARIVAGEGSKSVLDIAAGHGLYGILLAQQNPQARITAVDWPKVLEVARENARKFGVADRHSTVEGDAFEVEFGGPYDLVLVTNFFHHFDVATCEKMMRKVAAALKPGGQCVTVEFVPNEDRVSPSTSAGFAIIMLGSTPRGDAYTFREFESMFRNAGFSSSEFHALPRSPQSIIVSHKA